MSTSYDWMEEAKCRSLTQEQKNNYLFREANHTIATKAWIANLCGDCPVKEQCFMVAITHKIGPGCSTHIFGGMDYAERMKAIRRRVFLHIQRKGFQNGSVV